MLQKRFNSNRQARPPFYPIKGSFAMTEKTSFCHLHVHSQYSILESSLSIPSIVSKAKEYGMPSIAMTDHGNLYGAIDFYKTAKESGVKAIIGCEIAVAQRSMKDKDRHDDPYHIVLLAKNIEGYKNLCKLSSIAFTQGFYYIPRIDFGLLSEHRAGLICLSGHTKGFLAKPILANDEQTCNERIDQFHTLFGNDFYFEIQRHGSSQEDIEFDGMAQESWLYRQYENYITSQKTIENFYSTESKKRSIPLVATNNCHYLVREDWRAHEILLNIQSGEPCLLRTRDPHTNQSYVSKNPKRATFPSHEFFFKSPEEMQSLFSDIPEALERTGMIAEQCNISIDFQTKHYPVFDIPQSGNRDKEAQSLLVSMCEQAIPSRYTESHLQKVLEQYPDQDPNQVVKNRLSYELEIITSKGLTDYFLLVWDFIHWAKKKGIPVGPGRGSVVGSIVAFLIGITEIEPLRFNLFFERFINPGRISYPDIDVDLCMERRGEVISYIVGKYGREKVSQIITFGTMKAKMSVRDVGRALNVPLQKVNQLAKLIPDDLNITLEDALEKDADLKSFCESDEEAGSIMQAAKVLQGSIRNTGIHAAGVIICADNLVEHLPICTAKDSDLFATQYSMKPAEMVGMLKVDFLGLKTLTVLKLCADDVNRTRTSTIDWCNLPLDDKKTFSLINQGRTLGVFQIEEGGMQDLVQKLHIDRFEEIVALLSLYRPGPMEMIPTYIARKWGQEKVEYDHPLMEPILKETYGVMVYQEQIMQIASQLAGYTLGEGDVLRKAMGKKDAKEMAKQRVKFIEGSTAKGLSEETASSVFDKMEKFAEYGFNKSHSAAYGYLTYATAYFKAHYPSQWLAALMTGDKDDVEKVAKTMHEAGDMGIACLPPDINESNENFTATSKGIRFALNAVKGVGASAVEAIIEERRKKPFSSLHDVIYRTDSKRLGKKMIELLIEAGALDQFGWTRDELLASLDVMFEDIQRTKKEHSQGILNLFDHSIEETPKRYLKPTTPAKSRSQEEILFKEKQLLGLFVSGHPLRFYQDRLSSLACLTIKDAKNVPEGSAFRIAFVVETVVLKVASKSQRKFAILTVSDASGETLEIPVWPDLFDENQDILLENNLLWGVFAKERRDSQESIACKWISDLRAINQSEIERSYTAYEKAKTQFFPRGSQQGKKPKTTQDVDPAKKTPITKVRFDLAKLRASHIVAISQAMHRGNGVDCVHLSLEKNCREHVLLKLPPVDFEQNIRSVLKTIPSYVEQ